MKSIAALALLASCGWHRPARSTSEMTNVPFENDFGLIFIEVAVGDASPRWFLLDSGADQTLLDRDAARELGIPFGGDAKTAEPGGEIAIAHARDVTFRVGGAPFVASDVWVTPLGGLHRFVGRRFAGVLGHAFLERYVTTISYDARRITLHEPARFDYRGGGEIIPVDIAGAEAFLHATLDTGAKQVDAKLKIDTGSIDEYGLPRLFARIHTPGRLELTVRREGAVRKLDLKLRPLL
jgi:hypothetical protein